MMDRPYVPGTDDEIEFRQVGDTWLHAQRRSGLDGVTLTITNERWQDMENTHLTIAMARQLRDWLMAQYPPHPDSRG